MRERRQYRCLVSCGSTKSEEDGIYDGHSEVDIFSDIYSTFIKSCMNCFIKKKYRVCLFGRSDSASRYDENSSDHVTYMFLLSFNHHVA